MRFRQWFAEADREFTFPTPPDEIDPIQKGDRFRVFHGFYNMNDAINIAMHGASGKMRVGRTYSYESENNPKGMFVTLDLKKIASKFAGGVKTGVIMEFVADESELQPPTWPGGGYTVQGQMAQYFYQHPQGARMGRAQSLKDDEEEARKSSYPAISQSHRPGLAQTMFGSEMQALFTGDLDPGRIVRFWVQDAEEGADYRLTTSDWVPYTREQFLEKYGQDFDAGSNSLADSDARWRGMSPSQEFNWQAIADWFNREYRSRKEKKIETEKQLYDEFVGALVHEPIEKFLHTPRSVERTFGQYLWPRQLPRLQRWIVQMYRQHGEPQPYKL